MNLKQKQCAFGLVMLSAGFLMMAKSKTATVTVTESRWNPESFYLELNHLEHDLSKLSKTISQFENNKEVPSETVAAGKTELVSYKETQIMLLNLINWLKEKQLLFRNDVARNMPGFPHEERLNDPAQLANWKDMLQKGVNNSMKQVNNLNVDVKVKAELKNKFGALLAESGKIRWKSSEVVKKAATRKLSGSAPGTALINQMQKSIATMDKELVSIGQSVQNPVTHTQRNSTQSYPWMSWLLSLSGLAIIIDALRNMGQNKTVEVVREVKVETPPAQTTVQVSEAALFDRVKEAIFYLSGNYDVVWSNQNAKNLNMTKNDLRDLLKSAYKEESGKRISSFKNSDWWLDVQYLDQKMQDGSKIFCLIMGEAKESVNTTISMGRKEFETLMESSLSQCTFDFTKHVNDTLNKMAYIFKLSGTEFLYEAKNYLACESEFTKVELATKTFLSALHQLVKDDFESKAVLIASKEQNDRVQVSAFVPGLNVEGKLPQTKKLAYQVFLEDMVKVEKNLMAYSARVIIRSQEASESSPQGLYVELSFENKNALEKILKKSQVSV